MSKNVDMLMEVARGLKDLGEDVVFVGGATASLYFQEKPSLDIRPTDDVDCIVEVSSKMSYGILSERLHKLNFWHFLIF